MDNEVKDNWNCDDTCKNVIHIVESATLLCTNTMIYILYMNANSVNAKHIFRTASHVLVNKAIKDITNGR